MMSQNSENAPAAIVTGDSRGIGRAITLALARAGWNVVFSYKANAEAANEVLAALEAAGRPGAGVQADVADAGGRQALLNAALDRFGGVDLLVNNAGMAPRVRADLLEMGEESYDEVMATNLKGPFFLTQAVARVMVEQMKSQSGADPAAAPKIVNIGSLSAYTASSNRGEYCISKAGMGMMTALFADRLAADGILVYEVRPGVIATDMTSTVKAKYDKMLAEGVFPVRRWGQPEDVARAVVALASGMLPYSTGEIINVDGGFHLKRL